MIMIVIKYQKKINMMITDWIEPNALKVKFPLAAHIRIYDSSNISAEESGLY